MQNLINDAPSKRNYDFIDHIRCLAMMSIVFEHCFGTQSFPIYSDKFWAYISVVQLAKFGTVIFFLLAGFLIGDKFTDYTPGQYLKRRFSNTFGPWLFWSLVFVVCMIINLHITEGMYHDGRFTLPHVLSGIRTVYLFTNYWFIINFMVSITLLLIFKRYLYSPVFGAILLAFTLFYNVNIHFEWIDPSHTIAILGFIFFLWLGAQLRKHWAAVEAWILKVSYVWLVLAILITFALSCVEMIALMKNHSADPYNTLRFSNVLFSLSAFLLFLKIKYFKFLNILKPRQTTYGIYLIHYIIFIFLLNEITRPLNINEGQLSALGFILRKVIDFVIVYTITVLIVMGINLSPAKKIIGN
jgi:hypothetical protein